MDLRLTDEQVQLVDAASALYAKHASPELVQAAEPSGFDRDLWERLLELGAVATHHISRPPRSISPTSTTSG